MQEDIYSKLRPEAPTPSDELCDCEQVSAIYLAHKLGSNPIYCLCCNGEVLPERLAINKKFVEELASWNSNYGALYSLWLDSGEYEGWAFDRLKDPSGQVNRNGIELTKQLSNIIETYYLWFYDSDDGVPEKCPLCDCTFSEGDKDDFLFCKSCRVIV